MNKNILRQVKDIQYQAEKICTSSPSTTDIENFSKYSEEIKSFLLSHIEIPEIKKLVNDIPKIPKNESVGKKGALAFFAVPLLSAWYQEKQFIEAATSKINMCKGKYASIEFILKNYF